MTAFVGLDELVLLAGLAMLVAAFWPVLGRLSLAIPGAVLVWLAVPSREPFVKRPEAPVVPRRRL